LENREPEEVAGELGLVLLVHLLLLTLVILELLDLDDLLIDFVDSLSDRSKVTLL